MDLEKVREHIRQWIENTLSVPSPLFNNLPPCPYSREALLKNKLDIRCVDGAELLNAMTEIGNTWDDRYEIILLASEPDTIKPEELIAGLEKWNKQFEGRDLLGFCDHPFCTDPKYKVTSANGKYVLVGMQRLANFVQAAKPLHKKQYFAKVNKQFWGEEKINKLN